MTASQLARACSIPVVNALRIVTVLFLLPCFVSSLRYPKQNSVAFVNSDSIGGTLLGDGFTYIRKYLSEDIDGGFEFGFVRKTPDAYMLSIWLSVPSQSWVEIVWSANRNHPVRENATVSFLANGSLNLYDSDGTKVWSSDTDGLGAAGLDLDTKSGNLILYGDNNDTMWRSFDFPTDTLLQGQTMVPGMTLVSNVSATNSSEGMFTLAVDLGGVTLQSTTSSTQPYWMWGYFGSNQTDSMQKTCQHPTMLTFSDSDGAQGSLVMSQNASVTMSANNTDANLCNTTYSPKVIQTNTFPKNFTRFMRLDNDGNMLVFVYNGTLNVDYNFFPAPSKCTLPFVCGPYGLCSGNGQCNCPGVSTKKVDPFEAFNASAPEQGCAMSGGVPVCDPTQNSSQLLELKGVDYYCNKYNTADISDTTAEQCNSACSTNCSCLASFFKASKGTCWIITDQLQSLQSVSDQNTVAFIKVTSGAPISVKKAKGRSSLNKLALILGLVIPSIFAVVAIRIACFYFYWRTRRGRSEAAAAAAAVAVAGVQKPAEKTEDDVYLETLPGLPPRFSLKELEVATEGFSKQLGVGGFGTVYEGVLPDGTKIAVKKLEGAKQGNKEFRAEVATIGSIHHINLVRLRGFCVEGEHHMLVYEFMPNGSLDRWLFNSDPEAGNVLDWDIRYKIAQGTARGLAYLHEECRERIIHLDIKPQNILLDEKFLPKVADFGLAKVSDRDSTLVVTTMRGTPGYLAPEWLLQSAVTDRSDVYSYGMVLLELLTGRKNLDLKSTDSQKRYLPAWAVHEVEQGKGLELVDERLRGEFDEKQAMRILHLAFLCIQEDMDERPSMADVVQMLEGRVGVPERERLSIRSGNFGSGLFGKLLSSGDDSSSIDHIPSSLKDTMLVHLKSQGR